QGGQLQLYGGRGDRARRHIAEGFHGAAHSGAELPGFPRDPRRRGDPSADEGSGPGDLGGALAEFRLEAQARDRLRVLWRGIRSHGRRRGDRYSHTRGGRSGALTRQSTWRRTSPSPGTWNRAVSPAAMGLVGIRLPVITTMPRLRPAASLAVRLAIQASASRGRSALPSSRGLPAISRLPARSSSGGIAESG